jgi:hypothetical protein
MQIQRHIEQIASTRLVIDLPDSFLHQRVEVLVFTLEEPLVKSSPKRRVPPPQFAGQVKELGDVINTIPIDHWNLPQ